MSGRVSPRQAFVVLDGADGPPGRVVPGTDRLGLGLGDYVLLDVLGTLVAVNGASISLVCGSRARAASLARIVPPDVEMMLSPEGLGLHAVVDWAVRRHVGRAFARVVVVAGDTLALPIRGAATALGALGSAAVVLGPTTGGGLYLFGTRDEAGLGALRAAEPGWQAIDVDAAISDARAVGLETRRIERRTRLAELTELEALRRAVAADRSLAPRTAAFLEAVRPEPAPSP